MELIKKEWLGTWDNFEDYIDSTDPHLVQVWAEAEAAAKNMPMFARGGGVKAFWQTSCNTITAENPERLTGWIVTHDADNGKNGQAFTIDWLGQAGHSIGKYGYTVKKVLDKGLENKPNFLFVANGAPAGSPFTYLLSMEPMPERDAYLQGGFISHVHFQYASTVDDLLEDDQLRNPRWYPTMCAQEGGILEQVNLVRGLHKLPVLEQIDDMVK